MRFSAELSRLIGIGEFAAVFKCTSLCLNWQRLPYLRLPPYLEVPVGTRQEQTRHTCKNSPNCSHMYH